MIIKESVLCQDLKFINNLKPAKNCFAIALILAQSGEFALVLFSLANQAELLSNNLFQQLLLLQVRLEHFELSYSDFEQEIEHLNDAIEFLMESLLKRQYSED